MQTEVDLPAEWERRFQSGRPSLDFVHTGGAAEHSGWEIVTSTQVLEALLHRILGLPNVVLNVEESDLANYKSLRAAITHCAIAALTNKHYSASDIATLNQFASQPPTTSALTKNGTIAHTTSIRCALSDIARDAILLLSQEQRHRIHSCAADDCGLFFFDDSRGNTRRWCSMQRCGNRNKVRQHRTT